MKCIYSALPLHWFRFPRFPGSQVPALSSFSLGPGIRSNGWPYGRGPARWPALVGTRFYIVINYKTFFCFICLQLLACVVYRCGMKEKTMIPPKLSTPGKIDLARAALANDLPLLSKLVAAIPGDPSARGTTKYYATRFLSWFEDQNGPLYFSVFAESGNMKLPFYAFSSLPGFDCPGAGACLYGENDFTPDNFGKGWCYSFTGWRYPAAFFRQLQNSILLRSKAGRAIVASKFADIPEGRTVRLYVDGDFANLAILRFWMDQCKSRDDITIAGHNGIAGYGYSKSWKLFLELDKQGYKWPSNYLLNVSSGSRYGSTVKDKVLQLDCTRGEFVAVPVARKWITSKAYQDKDNEGSKEYRKEVLQALKEAGHEKRFACPGACGNCIARKKHACGEGRLRGVVIGIGIHSVKG